MKNINYQEDDGRISIDAEGTNPREEVQFVMNNMVGELDDTEIEAMHVEIETVTEESDDAVEAHAEPARADGGVEATPGGPQNASTGHTRNVDSWNRLDEDDRELGTVTERTVAHVVLSYVYDNGRLRSTKVVDGLDKLKDNTVNSALTQLYKKKVLNRDQEEYESGGTISVYSVSPHGEQIINEIGRYNQEQWMTA